MNQPINNSRLIAEIVATVAIASLITIRLLPEIAPHAQGTLLSVLTTLLLPLLAGPVIAWRLSAATRAADGTPRAPDASKRWPLFLGTAVVLTLGLAATAFSVLGLRREVLSEARVHFDHLSERLVDEVESRVTRPRYGLAGAMGMYAASKSVDRQEFAAYVQSRDLLREFPGAIGIGLVQRVLRADVDAFVAAERADGAPDFSIRSLAAPGSPLDNAPDLYVIKHCFPKERNAAAWGLDVGSEPIRREAAERAAMTGEPTISGKINLVQTGTDHTGFVYYLPIYFRKSSFSTPEERLAALQGLAYTPIILEEALAGVVAAFDDEMDFDIFEGSTRTRDTLIYDRDRHLAGASNMADVSAYSGRMFQRATPVTIGGKTWTIVTSTTPAFHAALDQTTATIMGICGTLLSLLLAGIVWTLGSSRATAVSLAHRMTEDLREAKAEADRLADIARRTSNAVIITDAQGRVEWVNESFTLITGYTFGDVKGRKPGHLLRGPETDRVEADKLSRAIASGSAESAELLNYRKDGRSYWVSVRLEPLRDRSGMLTGFMALETDITAQKAAIEALRVERERLEMAAASTGMGLWDWNPHTGTVQFDDRWAQMLGYRLEELPPHVSTWADRVHPEDLPSALAAAQHAMRTDAHYSCELRMRHRDGSWRWILAQGRVVTRNAEGQVTRFMGAHLDITERKRSELALSRATAMLERTGELAKVGGWSVDLDTMKLSWTLETFRIAEIEPPNEPDLEQGINLFAPEARPLIAAAVQAAMSTGTPYDLEVPLITAKGRKRWVKTQGYAEMKDGRPVRIFGTFQDITDRRLAELELKEVNERFRLATRAGRVGTWEYRVSDNSLTWDEQMFRLYGTTREHVGSAYDAWKSGVHPDDQARCDQEIQRALRAQGEFDTEFRVRWPDGTLHYIRAIAETQFDENGQAIRMLGTNWDVTEMKQAEERLRAANLRLEDARLAAEAASRAKSAFLANMSHEIRTPLTAILGYTDILREEGSAASSADQRLQIIETIKNAGQHLLTVINDILDLSKIEADKMVVERIDTPLIDLLREIEGLMRPRALGKGLSITTVLATPVPESIRSDPTRLRQILMNLVGNAVKFTQQGGITITARTVSQASRSRLLLEVEDTGVGLTDEQASNLFQAFGQADETTTRRFGGTGLGLNICRRLAALMGGEVVLARTQLGKGSCFRVDLPLDVAPGTPTITHLAAPSPQLEPSQERPLPSLQGRILLAEDGPDNQRLIAFHLRKAGAEVVVADNGRIALNLLQTAAASGTPFDLLLTDMQMPEMDGYTLARTLRAGGSSLAIVALTAHAMAEDRVKCIEAGCDDFVTKPIDKALLLAACTTWMGRPSTTTARAQAA